MRRSVLAAVLTVASAASGCHKAKPVGPAWPAPSATADDGGHSLDPAPTAVAASLEKSKDDDRDKAEAAEIVATPGAAAVEPEKPAVDTSAAEPTSGEVIMSEEIIIEIDE